MLERVLDRLRGDLVEGDAPELGCRHLDHICDVPGDRLTLTVEVGREPDVVGRLCLTAKGPDLLLGIVGHDVFGQERLEVDAHLRLGQIPDMPKGRLDLVLVTEHPFEGPGLRRRLNDDEVLFDYSQRLSFQPRKRDPSGPPTLTL
jgi:hypothetical protein